MKEPGNVRESKFQKDALKHKLGTLKENDVDFLQRLDNTWDTPFDWRPYPTSNQGILVEAVYHLTEFSNLKEGYLI